MKKDNKGFFSQRTFNIFFSGVFVFIMAMMLKEKFETPENYLEDVEKSETVAREQLAPPLKEIFSDFQITEGRTSRGSSSLSYALRINKSGGLNESVIKKIEANGWVQYGKDYHEEGRYLFCKDKYGLEVGENRGYTFATIKFSKSSPCWNFEEALKDDLYHLVE